MKYLCLLYLEASLQAQFDSQLWRSYLLSLAERGYRVTGDVLASEDSATTVQLRNNKIALQDGPYRNSGEHRLTGFYLLEARDLNEAIKLAADSPAARFGSIEVRPASRY